MNEMKHAINGLIPEAQYRLTIMLSGYNAEHYSDHRNIGVYYYLLKLISFFLSTFIKLLQFNVIKYIYNWYIHSTFYDIDYLFYNINTFFYTVNLIRQ